MRETPAAEALPSSPIAKARLYLVFLLFAVGFGYVIVGLALRQLIQTGDLKAQYDTQSRRVVLRPPSRGLIYDRNGYVLVENRIRWSIKADLLALQPEIHRKYLALIKAERVRGAPVEFDKLQDKARLDVLQGWLDRVWYVIDEVQPNKRTGDRPRPVRPSDEPERRVNAADLRKHLRERRALPFVLVTDLAFPGSGRALRPEEGQRTIARFIDQFPVNGPISLQSDIVRSYPHGSLAAHVLGYIKDTDELPEKVNELADLPMDNLQKLQYTGKKGASGIEQTFDAVLKGMSGWELWTKTSSGYNKELVASNPAQQGSAVNLSLDRDIQCAAERALAQIKDSKGELLPGAAVMLDVNTGEILALASQPTFDPNRLADRVTQVYFDEVDGKGGWMNRAIQGLYAPGSTFKVITAIAGLRHGIVDWDDILECGPSFRVGARDFPEHDPAGYGQVNLEKMLAVSCNVWNYMVGVRLGQPRLAAEARRFGLDTPLLTHVSDLVNGSPYELPYPAARTLVVPDAAYKQRIGAGPWTDGDTANSSIGQGYILTTPLHMACVAASLARGETRTTPSIIHDPGRDGRHVGAEPIGITEAQLTALRSGLERCVTEGTARTVRIPELPYAAKTGTSEYFKNGEKAHLAWIIGYAPADNPAVAFCVLVEGQLDTSTWGGKTAGPVARDMLTTWARKAEAPAGAQPPSDCQRK